MKSLSARLLIAVSALLLVFFGLAIVALESAFRNSAEQAIKDRLNVQMLMLISAADTNELGQLTLPEQLPEARLMSPGSGLIGQVLGKHDELIWRSLSAVGLFLPQKPLATPGETRFERAIASDGNPMFSYSHAIEWELSNGNSLVYTLSVAEGLQPYIDQVREFRTRLFTLFGALMAILLASQALVLRWVLRPLRQVEEEIEHIESGELAELSAGYPSELLGLTQNTNRLIAAERTRLSRYRNTLGNLAHSLKTPLAIVRSTLEKHELPDSVEATVQEQVDRMNDIVSYQLQRAAASGGTTLGHKRIEISGLVEALIESLQKVYINKKIACTLHSTSPVYYRAEKGDLMEIFGNLLDNSFKWSQGRIEVVLRADYSTLSKKGTLHFEVSDDGPGISPGDIERVLKRGQRADETVGGHGIGLSVVRELVELAEGQMAIDRSPLGGASIRVDLPPR